MGGKRNKIRYKSAPIERKAITLSGEVYLQYEDDDAIEQAKKGDLKLYPMNDSLNGMRLGEYGSTGFSGYFKVDVYDGRQWCLLLLNDIFMHRENHFSKSERPIDTYGFCAEILKSRAGSNVVRTYREHYMPEDGEEVTD